MRSAKNQIRMLTDTHSLILRLYSLLFGRWSPLFVFAHHRALLDLRTPGLLDRHFCRIQDDCTSIMFRREVFLCGEQKRTIGETGCGCRFQWICGVLMQHMKHETNDLILELALAKVGPQSLSHPHQRLTILNQPLTPSGPWSHHNRQSCAKQP